MDKETLLDFVIGFAFFVLLIGGPLLLIKTNKNVVKDALNKPSLGCCCLPLMLFVWFCILSVIMAIIFYLRHGYVPG